MRLAYDPKATLVIVSISPEPARVRPASRRLASGAGMPVLPRLASIWTAMAAIRSKADMTPPKGAVYDTNDHIALLSALTLRLF